MTTFHKSFAAYIESEHQTPAEFARRAGISPPYLSQILGREKKFPTVDGLEHWLRAAKASESVRETLTYLCAIERAQQDPNYSGFIVTIKQRERDYVGLLQRVLDLAIKGGAQIPQALIDRIKAL